MFCIFFPDFPKTDMFMVRSFFLF